MKTTSKTGVGHFWVIVETELYVRARFAHIRAALQIKIFLAAKVVALENLLDLLRLCRSVDKGARELVPSQIVHVGRE
jgi:hypothetical protein